MFFSYDAGIRQQNSKLNKQIYISILARKQLQKLNSASKSVAISH